MSISPANITKYIRHQQEATLTSVRCSHPEEALLRFIKDMEQLCSGARSSINPVHISAVFMATAKVWVAAMGNHKFWSAQFAAHREVEMFLLHKLNLLRLMLPDTRAQAVSNIMWSSAKLGLTVSEPEMVNSRLERFLLSTEAPTAAERPKAQEVSNLVWAIATMQHTTTSNCFIDMCCAHFGRLMKTSEAREQPNAQNVANLLWGLATWGTPRQMRASLTCAVSISAS